MKLSKKKKRVITVALSIILILLVFFLMIFNGYIIPTKLEAEKYEVRGVDVSEYQGEVDWDRIKSQGISFAFIKATEGSKSKDDYFDKNFEKLKNMDMLLGIYHFFSFETIGNEQAQNYINTVGYVENDDSIFLPIIDVEYYSYYKKAKPYKEWIIEELQTMLDKLESTYRVKPMIYTTMEFYNDYIDENFSDYDIWIRDIVTKPSLENRDWRFWQYTGKGRLDGYIGQEKFIDLNVFNGSKDDFDNFIESKKQEKKDNFLKEEQEKIERKENTIISEYGALVTDIEGNIYTVETDDGGTLKVTLTDDLEVTNKRTKEKFNISDIKINDKLNFENVYERQGEVVFTEDSKVYVVRNIRGDELKSELLKGEIDFEVEDTIKSGNNYILKGQMIDWNYTTDEDEAEKFELEIIVNNNTQILGITGNPEEQLKRLNSIIYVTFYKGELKKGNFVATNIETMGC